MAEIRLGPLGRPRHRRLYRRDDLDDAAYDVIAPWGVMTILRDPVR